MGGEDADEETIADPGAGWSSQAGGGVAAAAGVVELLLVVVVLLLLLEVLLLLLVLLALGALAALQLDLAMGWMRRRRKWKGRGGRLRRGGCGVALLALVLFLGEAEGSDDGDRD